MSGDDFLWALLGLWVFSSLLSLFIPETFR